MEIGDVVGYRDGIGVVTAKGSSYELAMHNGTTVKASVLELTLLRDRKEVIKDFERSILAVCQ